MNTLIIDIENCYGIRKLEYTFNFEGSKVYSIYAPNGVMKTSFSKTFADLSKNKESKDLVFHERISKREIIDGNGVDINSENIFVIEPYNEKYSSEKTSLLLVNQDIKRQYDAALLKIEKKKKLLFEGLKQISGLNGRTTTPESELLTVFNKSSIFEVLEEIEEVISSVLDKQLSEINYCVLFNEKTVAFLESGQITLQLKEYINKYNELLDKSDVLSKSFNHYHANEVLNNLSTNGFFKANHSVKLFNGKEKEEISTAKHLEQRIAEEKKKILSDAVLSKKFDAIDKKLRNVELRNFRDCLFENQDIISRLSDYKKLQKDIWLAYFLSQHELFLDFIEEYKKGRIVIQNSITTAKNEKTKWIEVVDLFNKRFSPVPFNIEISNQDDVILKDSSPKLLFNFLEKGNNPQVISRDSLLAVLSQGEKRTLYILNILFEINARKNDGIKTLFVFDDIADSFDYKNKYAIVEYLKDVSESTNFYAIFLTHNYDFHRTISSRLKIPRENCLFTVKNSGVLNLTEDKYQNDPFKFWKRNFHTKEEFVISSIPFVRNLAEYCGYTDEKNKLTSLLHMKVDTQTITINDLEEIYRVILKDIPNLRLAGGNKIVIELLFEIAEVSLTEPDEKSELESKIILSVAIRLLAEKFMIRRISDQFFVDEIKKDQTKKLIERFRIDFSSENEAIKILERVNLMTPENIHLNSFMFEPILDMSPEHLKNLYRDVKELNANSSSHPITVFD